MRRLLVWLVVVAGCASGPAQPVDIDPTNDACRRCRMIVSDVRLAAQIVSPGDEPLIFDDLACLRDYLAATPTGSDAAIYVADHRTGAWVRAERAVYSRVSTVSTPMGSGLLAHESAASRDADSVARDAGAVDGRSILGDASAHARVP